MCRTETEFSYFFFFFFCEKLKTKNIEKMKMSVERNETSW